MLKKPAFYDVIVAENMFGDIISDLGAGTVGGLGMAASADEAWRLASLHRPDLVLMDIHLEGQVDGTEAGTRILGELAIPVVYLTAFAEPETLQRAEDSQPYGYLLKPVDLLDLEACLG